jgi:hypothetical protein
MLDCKDDGALVVEYGTGMQLVAVQELELAGRVHGHRRGRRGGNDVAMSNNVFPQQ